MFSNSACTVSTEGYVLSFCFFFLFICSLFDAAFVQRGYVVSSSCLVHSRFVQHMYKRIVDFGYQVGIALLAVLVRTPVSSSLTFAMSGGTRHIAALNHSIPNLRWRHVPGGEGFLVTPVANFDLSSNQFFLPRC